MRLNLLSKVILPLLLVSALPLAAVSLVSLTSLRTLESASVAQIDQMREVADDDSISSLSALGKEYVKSQALSTMRLIDLYLRTHPKLKAADLIKDEEFQRIGVQQVGERGYTVVTEQKEQVLVAYPNKALMGIPLLPTFLKNPAMQDWYHTVKPSIDGDVDADGYYRWPEKDGSFSDKYLYIAQIPTPTADGIHLFVSATTYVSEFNRPAVALGAELGKRRDAIAGDIAATRDSVEQTIVLLAAILLLCILLSSILFGSRLVRPIKRLTAASKLMAGGDLSKPVPDVQTSDEISDLSMMLETMRRELRSSRDNLEQLVDKRTVELLDARKRLEGVNVDLEHKVATRTGELLRLKDSLEKTVAERTKDLNDKVSELERMNKLMIGRELKIAELKEELSKKKAK